MFSRKPALKALYYAPLQDAQRKPSKVTPELARSHGGQEGLPIPAVERSMVPALPACGEHLHIHAAGHHCWDWGLKIGHLGDTRGMAVGVEQASGSSTRSSAVLEKGFVAEHTLHGVKQTRTRLWAKLCPLNRRAATRSLEFGTMHQVEGDLVSSAKAWACDLCLRSLWGAK